MMRLKADRSLQWLVYGSDGDILWNDHDHVDHDDGAPDVDGDDDGGGFTDKWS